MAAKQGTLAQLSAQAEDAKRAVLSKAGAGSWFSNLNTVCTIKSAPPRSPEVLQLLATKAGWLYKRNEQHVWQARWCCVVPHTFLYYFDAPTVGGGSVQNPAPAQQEEWNRAVLTGLGNRKPHEKRSHFPLFHGGAAVDTGASNEDNDSAVPSAQNLQPAGIIDLECYSTIYRSSENGAILQLAGDDQVNPDLRSFYFCCDNSQEVEEWNSALLDNRHAALQDEVEAYMQVADGFAQQLQLLHSDLDKAMTQQEETDKILYRVRSAAEETRRTVYRVSEECWERPVVAATAAAAASGDIDTLPEKRAEFLRHMETIRQQDMGVGAAVRLLADYIAVIEDLCAALQQSVKQLQTDVQKSGQTDQAEIQELQAATEAAAKQHAAEKEQLLQQLAAAQAASQAATKELKDVQKDLSSTKMEVTMLMSQQRNKLATQQQHKKILKKEVIDLRQKVEDVGSEHSSLQHEYEKLKLQLEQERSKSDLLTRYIDKMESQVQAQQNMMDMMSQAGGSVYGGGSSAVHQMSGTRSIASRNDYKPKRRNLQRNSVDADGDDDDDDDDFDHDAEVVEDFENDERILMQPPNISASPAQFRRRRMTNQMQHHNPLRRGSSFLSDNDVDNKSHVSELTEDRTQREFAAFQSSQQYLPGGDYRPECPVTSPKSRRQQEERHRKRIQEQLHANYPPKISGPPSVIIGVKKNDTSSDSNEDDAYNQKTPKMPSNQALETIHSSSGSARSLQGGSAANRAPPPAYRSRGATLPRAGGGGRDSASVGCAEPASNGSGRDSASLGSASVGSADHASNSNSNSNKGTRNTNKLSVAQRARLDADTKTTPVRARLDEMSLSSLQRQIAGNNLAALANIGVTPNKSSSPSHVTFHSKNISRDEQEKASSNSSPQHSQSSGLWRRVEEAVLGPRLMGDEYGDDDDDESASEGSTRITDYTDGGSGDDQPQQQPRAQQAIRHFANRGVVRDVGEKKSSDSVSLSNLSLQERSQLQRDKQLHFLREQGLIKSESDVKGGAGALDAGSVTSSNAGGVGGGSGSSSPMMIKTPQRKNHV